MRALIGVLAGCGPVGLDRVEVDGGTPEQRAVVDATVADFDVWTGERVELGGIRFGRARHAGRYNPVTRRITLADDVATDDLPAILRHELCHALDKQEGLVDRKGTPIDGWVDTVLDEENGLAGGAYRGRQRRRSETFALWCQNGPLHAQLLADRCPDDTDGTDDVTRWLLDRVWTDVPALGERPTDPPSPATWVPAFEPTTLGVTGTTEPGVLQIAASRRVEAGSYEFHTAFVDLETGDWIAPRDGLSGREDYEPVPFELELPSYSSTQVDGLWAGMVGVDLFEQRAGRVLYWDGESLSDGGCAPPNLDVFVADGRVWRAWVDHGVHWTALGP